MASTRVAGDYNNTAQRDINQKWDYSQNQFHTTQLYFQGSRKDILLNCDPPPFPLSNFNSPHSNIVKRADYLNKINTLVEICLKEDSWDNRIILLYGLGGVGKTELARLYAEELANRSRPNQFDYIVWINAETKKALYDSFVEFAQVYLNQEVSKVKKDVVPFRVYEWFSQNHLTGLLIFDNAEEIHGIEGLPKMNNSSHRPIILVTSRSNNWDIRKTNKLYVGGLKKEDAVTYIQSRLEKEELLLVSEIDTHAALKLWRKFQGFPLGLHLALSSILKDFESPDVSGKILNYIDRMKMPHWIKEKHHNLSGYELTMHNVWDKTFNNIKDNFPSGVDSIRVLDVLSLIKRDCITVATVNEVVQCCLNQLRHIRHNECLGVLNQYSLIIRNIEDGYNKIDIHRLVQRCRHQYLSNINHEFHVFRFCNNHSQLNIAR